MCKKLSYHCYEEEGVEMNLIPTNIKHELDKLINIAKKYRNNTISESLFYDVVRSTKEDKIQIIELKEYIIDAGISFASSDYDVEDTDEDFDGSSKIKPYDTVNIDISPKLYTIDILIARLQNDDEIDLLPEFQRRPNLWTAKQKSQLIESLIMRIPLPAFYFDGSNNDRWVVIDGLQRLCALNDFFVDKTLTLTGLEFLDDLNDLTIDDMPRAYERRMKETQVTAYVINPGAPINLKYNIFKRINTGGLLLEPQEIRHALYQGFSRSYLKELSDLEIFKKATGYSVNTDRMLDREFVLRFIAFYEQGSLQYQGSIEHYLNDAMDIINEKYGHEDETRRAEMVKKTFIDSLNLNVDLFGRFAFRRMPDMEKRRPISKALFETWTVCLARLSKDDCEKLITKKNFLLDKYMSLHNENDFIEAIGSAKVTSVRRRFEKIEGLIKEVLSDGG
jgi:hypothetical protein